MSVQGVWVLNLFYSKGTYSNYDQQNKIINFLSFSDLVWFFFNETSEEKQENYLYKYRDDSGRNTSYSLNCQFISFGQTTIINSSLDMIMFPNKDNQDLLNKILDDDKFFVPKVLKDILDEQISIKDIHEIVFEYLFDISQVYKLVFSNAITPEEWRDYE